MNPRVIPKPHQAVSTLANQKLPGTKGPIDRNFDLVVTTD